MEPSIQYAKTEDGVNIAFWTLGTGKPFVHMAGLPFAHAQLVWQIPQYRRWFERLAERWTVIRYDNRGHGLSDRNAIDFSVDSLVGDLEAVTDCLGLERFALFAQGNVGPIAIAYAARCPARVSHLLLWCTWARTSDSESPQLRGLGRMMSTNWELYTQTVAHALWGWSESDLAHRFAEIARESATQETAMTALGELRGVDVTGLLPDVRSPTLVLHRRKVPTPDVNVARGLASAIPGARLALLEGESTAPPIGNMDAVLSAIDEFLGDGEQSPERPATLASGAAIILFADIADSTALTEQLGDAAFRTKATGLDGLLRKLIRDADGTPVEGKVLGDGVMAVFTSARGAIDCALRCKEAGDEGGLPLHLGIHAGDVIREGNTVYGGAVNLAQRITDASAAGEILVSDTVRSLARTSTEVRFENRGEQQLKGIAEPQRLFAVRESAGGG